MKSAFILILSLALLPLPVTNCRLLAGEILAQPNPLSTEWLVYPDATKTLMRSGYDYDDGNYDSGNLIRVEPPGLSFSNAASAWVLFDRHGPGVITSIWFTGKSKKGQAYIGGRLNFFFDGKTVPSVSVLLPEIFESGNVFPKPLAEKSSGGWVSYAPIYFAKSLKITISDHGDSFTHRKNSKGESIPHIYHQFTWQQLKQPVVSSSAATLKKTRTWSTPKDIELSSTTINLLGNARTQLFRAEGPGVLNKIQIKWGTVLPDTAKIIIKADGTERVSMTASELWGHSQKKRPQAQFQSLLMGITREGTYYSRWPMPYTKVLLIECEPGESGGEISLSTAAKKTENAGQRFYFNASRIKDTTQRNRDIKVLEAQGRGHYVGAVLELANKTLEGDDRFYVDGEAFPPSWHGTGTEDYFRCGWYFFGGALTRPLYGMLDNGTPKIAYRFHLADRVNYTQSVVIGFEHGHANDYMGPFNGTVFWYSEK